MKNKIKKFMFVCAFAVAALVSTSQTAKAQFISKAVFAKQFANGEAKDVLMVFSPNDKTVFCVIGLGDAAPNATFKFSWKYYDMAQRKDVDVYEQELTNQSGKTIASKLSMPKGLSEGAYHVELSIDGKVRRTLRFRVVKDQF